MEFLFFVIIHIISHCQKLLDISESIWWCWVRSEEICSFEPARKRKQTNVEVMCTVTNKSRDAWVKLRNSPNLFDTCHIIYLCYMSCVTGFTHRLGYIMSMPWNVLNALIHNINNWNEGFCECCGEHSKLQIYLGETAVRTLYSFL